MRIPTVVIACVAALVAGGCGGDDGDDPSSAATELAPSQTGAGTAAPPTLPPPCDLDALDFEAAPPASGSIGSIVVTNTGPAQCEIDVSRSPIAHPASEPDAWLEAGGQAELTLDDAAPGCSAPADLAVVRLNVNGESVEVPISLTGVCQLSLVAVAPR